MTDQHTSLVRKYGLNRPFGPTNPSWCYFLGHLQVYVHEGGCCDDHTWSRENLRLMGYTPEAIDASVRDFEERNWSCDCRLLDTHHKWPCN